jgi:hypothetical protein
MRPSIERYYEDTWSEDVRRHIMIAHGYAFKEFCQTRLLSLKV